MSNGAVIEALTQGPKVRVVKTFAVTIPEGLSRREIAPVIRRSPLTGNYLRASGTAAVLRRVHRLGAPRGIHTAEGFLFPATYTALRGRRPRAAGRPSSSPRSTQNFAQRRPAATPSSKNLTRYDVLIIASMIEREAQLARERPLVAAVIYNRLKQGMPLGDRRHDPLLHEQLAAADPAVRARQATSRTTPALNRGLPPTPIGNPGLASLKAAAHPAHKSYLFYVRKPGNSGEHAFSSTDAQFERDVSAYQASAQGQVIRLGVCGWPVGPLALAARCTTPRWPPLGLHDWRYQHLPLPPELFAETVRALPAAGFRGVNVTIPHKEAALAARRRGDARPRARSAPRTR